MIGAKVRVRDRSRSIGKTVRAISKTLARRTGEAKAQVMALNQQAGQLIARSARKPSGSRRGQSLGPRPRRPGEAQGRQQLEELASRCGKVAEQIDRRVRGLKITDRLVSIADPDARPIRKGKLGKPTEFGYVAQICEVTENTRKGARGFILPAGHQLGNPAENTLLPHTAAELERAGIRLARDRRRRRLSARPDQRRVPGLDDEQIQISGRHEPGSRPHPQTPSALPNRDRGTDQSPQTQLRSATDPDSKEMTGCRSGPAGQSSPTTSTPSPSEPAETLQQAQLHPGNHSQA